MAAYAPATSGPPQIDGAVLSDDHHTNGARTTGPIDVLCGPLLNYKYMTNGGTASPTWHGSVLVVTSPGQMAPSLRLRPANASSMVNGDQPHSTNGGHSSQSARTFQSEKLYQDEKSCFWRMRIDLPISSEEAKWEYTIPDARHLTLKNGGSELFTKTFHVPCATESMRIMFHSCNGFSLGTDVDAWSGCALWNDVMRTHEKKPFHVMIGGGDQIYNDNIKQNGPLRPWCEIANPIKRRDFPFTDELRAQCDKHYFENYMNWYSTEPFSYANGSIPQINIWDDHDIIDGFGSYTDLFMKCAVFRGIGGIAHKYYVLFQHHVPPPSTTYTTDSDATQKQNSYVMKEEKVEPAYVMGDSPGPYVEEPSRHVYCELGAHVAFLGIDARTERTRHQINYPETYDKLFAHASNHIKSTSGRIKHFILLLGVPIAYPRLQWLENILQSPLIGVVRFLNKRFGVAGGLFNEFDGGVDLMDDLDDHYTAHQHKKERKDLIQRLQKLSKAHNVRVTILGGDVHLAAFGRFYSKPHENLPINTDHRYMANIVSSAITNHPPPQAVANLLARRNKIHHLDHHTDETLLNIWDKDPAELAGVNIPKKSANANHCTMPSRNYAIISESSDTAAVDAAVPPNGGPDHNAPSAAPAAASDDTPAQVHDLKQQQHHNWSKKPGNPRNALHSGEDNAGAQHPAANGITRTGKGGKYGLDVTFKIEVDCSDKSGRTEGYGISVPALEVAQGAPIEEKV